MKRRTYIYWALPLFVLLSCGRFLESGLGTLGALIVASVAAVAAWGVVWMRLYSMGSKRPEFSMLSVLPQLIYFLSRFAAPQFFENSPAWQNIYALSWLGFAGVSIASVRPGVCDGSPAQPLSKDPLFLLMVALIILYTISTFYQYYTILASI